MLKAAVFDPHSVLSKKDIDELTKAHKLSEMPTGWNLADQDEFMLVDMVPKKDALWSESTEEVQDKNKLTVLMRSADDEAENGKGSE